MIIHSLFFAINIPHTWFAQAWLYNVASIAALIVFYCVASDMYREVKKGRYARHSPERKFSDFFSLISSFYYVIIFQVIKPLMIARDWESYLGIALFCLPIGILFLVEKFPKFFIKDSK